MLLCPAGISARFATPLSLYPKGTIVKGELKDCHWTQLMGLSGIWGRKDWMKQVGGGGWQDRQLKPPRRFGAVLGTTSSLSSLVVKDAQGCFPFCDAEEK